MFLRTIEKTIEDIYQKYPKSKVINFDADTNKFTIICENGHSFLISYGKLKVNQWCRSCFLLNKQIKNNNILKAIFEKHPKSKLLSSYSKMDEPINFVCENDHLVSMKFNNLKQGKWCKFCNKPQVTIERIKEFVKEAHNGECLDDVYISQSNDLTFKCEYGHVFKRTWQDVYNNYWCRHKDCCNRFIPTADYIKSFIKDKHGGVCLLEEYISSSSKFCVKCKNGHEWETCWNYITRGNWCPECYGNVKKALEEINSYVFDNYGGECISKEYKNNRQKLQFRCAKGHEWETAWHTIYSSKCWCPICNDGFGESFCRFVFEKTFNKQFPKVRPDWLINNEGNQMELDGFCEELNLAFEYDGRQHKEIVSKFKMTKADLQRRLELDKFKNKKCKEVGVTLIRIPEFDKKFTQFKFVEFLEKQLSELGIKFIEGIDVSEFYK